MKQLPRTMGIATGALFLVGQAGLAATNTGNVLGPPETISGKILTVDPSHKLMIVKDPAVGVILDMRVTPGTRIRLGTRAVQLKDLTANANVVVRFLPERSGDIARLVEISN